VLGLGEDRSPYAFGGLALRLPAGSVWQIQPGDFDAGLAAIDPREVQVVEPGSGAKVTIVVSVEGEDAERLQQLAAARNPAYIDQRARAMGLAPVTTDTPSRPIVIPVHVQPLLGQSSQGAR